MNRREERLLKTEPQIGAAAGAVSPRFRLCEAYGADVFLGTVQGWQTRPRGYKYFTATRLYRASHF